MAEEQEHSGVTSRSPWTPLGGVRQVRVSPPRATPSADVEIPGSKSLTNRALILAALADGQSVIHGLLKSDDSYWCVEALKSLGIDIQIDGTTATVQGCGGQWPKASGEVFTGSSGTLSRFLPAALAAGQGEWTLRATPQMSRRPVQPLMDALQALGTKTTYLEKEGYYPCRVRANGLVSNSVVVPGNVSSQYLSALLMASPYADGPVEITVQNGLVQPAYIELTLDLMRHFGGIVEAVSPGHGDLLATGAYAVEGASADAVYRTHPSAYKGQDVQLEADASTAAYFFAFAALTGGRVRLTNLSADTIQPDIGLLLVLERMGAKVVRGDGWIEVQGDRGAKLKGGFTMSLHEMSDQALTVGILAVFADGPVTVTDVAHIRAHESDRISALVQSLAAVGIQVDEQEDGFTVYPGVVQPGIVPTFDDHRVAMATALLGTVVPGIIIDDPGCVSKTCPDFFHRLVAAGAEIELI